LVLFLGLVTLLNRAAADQVVYLSRPAGGRTWEPYFNPKTITANVGERVHFLALFEPLPDLVFPQLAGVLTCQGFLPFPVGFCRVELFEPLCVQPRYCKSRTCLLKGIFSGYIYVDPVGSANGSIYTITVDDEEPRFFYMVTGLYLQRCSWLGIWSTFFRYDTNWDVLFVLNPVIPDYSI
jgi:hypothetical protein